MATSLTSRIAAEHAAAELAHAGAWREPQRRRALAQLLARELPGPRDENWKYANLRPLERARFTPPASAAAPGPLPPALPGFARYVFVDGRFAAEFSASSRAGVQLGAPAAQAAARPAAVLREHAEDRQFALLNEAFATDGVSIASLRDADPLCVELVFYASGAGAGYPRTDVRVAQGTQLRLIERHLSAPDAASLTNGFVNIHVEPDACLSHFRLQAHAPTTSWIDTLDAEVGERGVYRLHSAGVGALTARTTARVRLAAPHAQLALHAAVLGEGQQVADSYVRVEHAAPDTRTEEVFRGIAAGRARVAFNAHIVVMPGARGSDSRQSLRGLLAGPQAEVDARPQLEIYTDEVRCNHGATAGKLDDAMLFYLLTRGIEPEIARSLLKWAFLEDTVSRIDVPAWRAEVERVLAAHLKDSTVSAGLI